MHMYSVPIYALRIFTEDVDWGSLILVLVFSWPFAPIKPIVANVPDARHYIQRISYASIYQCI
jgi:hypothetical protein